MSVDPATAAMVMVAEIFKFSTEVLSFLKIDEQFGRKLKKLIEEESEIRESLSAQYAQDVLSPDNSRDDNLISKLELDLSNVRLDITNIYTAIRVAVRKENDNE